MLIYFLFPLVLSVSDVPAFRVFHSSCVPDACRPFNLLFPRIHLSYIAEIASLLSFRISSLSMKIREFSHVWNSS